MLRDRHWLKTRQRQLAKGTPQQREAFEKRLAASHDKWTQRSSGLPKPDLDNSLPIAEREDEIAAAIREHQVVVISGETGSGKSTQLPLIAMRAGFGVSGMIGHTQPRRIAARSVSARIAQQLGPTGKSDVGFKIRFTDETSQRTYVKLMTDGILLAETRSDSFLNDYELIIVDEAHERSLNIDFLLGSLKRMLVRRPELRLIITSATINTERFAEHFSVAGAPPVPVINVEGRTFPVDVIYRPLDGDSGDGHDAAAMASHVVDTCRELAREDDGDMLVFLPTEAEIRDVSKKLKSGSLPGRTTEVLPLYSRLSTDKQNTIFNPGKSRRIVLATNVAESSITVPRIRFVIDTGTARISRYSARSQVQRLPIEAVSQASARQRAGRCGRIGPGICVRLYSEDDFDNRSAFTTPEIRRTNLASVILQTLSLKLGPVDQFPFIDPPLAPAIRDGYKTLFEIGAVDDHRRLTPLGRKLARLPVDPRIGKMILTADRENCLAEMLVIASALEVQSPCVRPPDKRQAADTAHEKWANEKSDFLSMLNLWDFWHELKQSLSRGQLKKAAAQNFLSLSLMHQWQETYRQLKSMAMQEKLKSGSRRNDENAIHRSLLSGLLSSVAMAGDRGEYMGAGGTSFNLWPGSDVFAAKPKWIIAAEVVETSRRYGRTIGKISPEWIEPLAGHLINRRYTDIRWSKKQQSVVASEHASLYGLPIVAGRQVHYGRIDPETARETFIDEGLCGDEYDGTQPFYQHNQWVLEQITDEAARTRDRDLVVDPWQIANFYREKIPAAAFDVRSLNEQLKSDAELDSRLRMTRRDLIPEADVADTTTLFPDAVQIGSMNIPVQYKFSPGDADDGATVRLPVEGIGQLDDIQAGWLIPGLLESRIVELIRALPKPIRRLVVPAPETAQKIASEIDFGKGSFRESVAMHLSRIAGQPISAESFKLEKLPPHLNVNVQIVDAEGQTVAEGRSLTELREQLGPEAATTVVEVTDSQWHQDGLKEWSWGELPTEITVTRGSTQMSAWPMIVDQGDTVGLRLADSLTAAKLQTRQGVTRLLAIQNRKHLRSQVNWLPNFDSHAVRLIKICNAETLKQGMADLIMSVAVDSVPVLPSDAGQYASVQQRSVELISIATQEVAKWLPRLADSVHGAKLAIESLSAARKELHGDIGQQIATLTGDGFLRSTPWRWLKEYPRFFDAIAARVDKISPKDAEMSNTLQRYWEQYETLAAQHRTQGIVDAELVTFRWMVEEFRVSLFAQKLGTSLTVSEKRLDKQWAKVRRV